MPPPEKVVKEFPRERELQLFRLERLHEFQCVRCQTMKKSKLVSVQGGDWSNCSATAAMACLQSRRT
jgi:hypothetical protein